jgi:hypothetical protein
MDSLFTNILSHRKNFNSAADKLSRIRQNLNIQPPRIIDNGEEFRALCTTYMDYIRMIELPTIQEQSQKEAVLAIFDASPHTEFVIRNAVLKLGAEWSHTIVCHESKSESIQPFIASISQNIKIIHLPCENREQYNQFVKTADYWNLFHGDKLFHYTPYSSIFTALPEEFLTYDYISASHYHELGNGYLNLRTKQTMLDILQVCSSLDEESEDMFFSKKMVELSLGDLADKETSFKFSSENQQNPTSFAGDEYWLRDSAWKDRIFKHIIIRFRPFHNVDNLEFRGGWGSVLRKLIKIGFFDDKSPYPFFDILEQHFTKNKKYTCLEKWCGVIHLTQNAPPYLENENIRDLFKNEYFLKSMDTCVILFSLSTYVTDFLRSEFATINRQVQIITLKHPVVQEGIIPFSMDKYTNNRQKRLLQIGQQYRKMTSIYRVHCPGHTRQWLTGTTAFKKLSYRLKQECQYLNIRINHLLVQMYYTATFEEYDELLCQNVVFVDLFDAAANNTVLECIVRQTPLIINRVGGVEEYLGVDYPLYFSSLDEVPGLLTVDNLNRAHEYLKNICTHDLTIDFFVKGLLNGLETENW